MKKLIYATFLITMMLGLTSCNNMENPDTLEYTTPFFTETSTLYESEYVTPEPPGVTDAEEPTLYVTEELDKEKKAVKITLMGDGMYYFPDLNGEFVEDYRYKIGSNSSGYYQDYPLPMEGPVVAYLPLSNYLKKVDGEIPLIICKVAKDGRSYEVEYTLSLEIASLYSDESIILKNDFLHAAITRYFDGEYSERDLLEIERLDIYYFNPILHSYDKSSNSIHIHKRGSDEQIVYYYSDFYDTPTADTPSVIPADIIADLEFFDALGYLTLGDNSQGETKELYLKIMWQIVKGYRVTENTWDQR